MSRDARSIERDAAGVETHGGDNENTSFEERRKGPDYVRTPALPSDLSPGNKVSLKTMSARMTKFRQYLASPGEEIAFGSDSHFDEDYLWTIRLAPGGYALVSNNGAYLRATKCTIDPGGIRLSSKPSEKSTSWNFKHLGKSVYVISSTRCQQNLGVDGESSGQQWLLVNQIEEDRDYQWKIDLVKTVNN